MMKLKQWSQRLRHVALICAAVFGLTAFGDDYFWSGTATSWSDDGAWTTSPANTSNYVINKDATITVTGNQSVTTGLFIENAAATIECTSGSSLTLNAAYVGTGMGDGALTLKNGNFVIGDGAINLSVWDNGVGSLTIDGASVSAPSWIRLGVWNTQVAKKASLTIKNGGSLSLWHIQSYLNGASTITLDGGSLVYYGTEKLGNNWEQGDNTVYGADGKTWQPVEQSVVIGSAGGTISVPENATVTVAASVKGVGTLTKTGAGTLVATGDMAGFIGKVAVAEGAGAVTLPANAARARAGDYTSKTENQDGTFTFAYDANGAAAESLSGTLLSLDFEDAESYAEGWTKIGTIARGNRNSDGDIHFLRVAASGTGSSKAEYVTDVLKDANSYTVSFDYFPVHPYAKNDGDINSYLRLKSDNGANIISVEMPKPANNDRTGRVYFNGSSEASVTFNAATRGEGSNEVPLANLWIHFEITATQESGVLLTMTQSGNNICTKKYVCDFAELKTFELYVKNYQTGNTQYGGIDDILITTSSAVAAIGDATFATFADAVAEASATSTIKLYSDVNLTSSLVLPVGATIDLNGCVLYSEDAGVTVKYNDGIHSLAATALGGITTFASTVVINDDVNVWTGDANDNKWSTPGNWSRGAAPSGPLDVVYIPAGEPVSIECGGSTDHTGILTIERDVTLSGNEKGISLSTVKGSGKLKLNSGSSSKNFYLYPVSGGAYAIYCDLEIANLVYNAQYDSNNGWILQVYGAVTGNGSITHNPRNNTGFAFHGDTSRFAGSYAGERANWIRDETAFVDSARGSALAKWEFGRYADDNKNVYRDAFKVSDVKYMFGQLAGHGLSMLHARRATIEVGARANETSNVGMTLTDSSNKIVKVGDTSTLNLTLTEAKGAVEAEAGTLNLKGAVAPESLTITGAGATVTVENVNTAEPSLDASLATGYQLVKATGEDATTYTVAAKCTITWKVDGQDDEVVPSYVGAEVSHVGAVRTGYVFDRWDPEVVSPATGNATYTAIWKAADVAVAQPVVTYGADYEKATVTADVTVTTPGDVTYELTVTKGSTSKKYTGGTVANGKVTFKDVEVPRTTDNIYADITYTVTPKSGSTALTTAATTEAPMSKMTWGFESKVADSKVSSTGGSWGETPVVKENKLSFTDGGTFTATNVSSDDIVVITMDDICFGDVNAEDVEGTAQAGVRIGQSGDNYTFQVYTANTTWLDAVGPATVDPAASYDVVVTINYSTGKYSVAVDGTLLTAGSSTSFALAALAGTPKSVSAVEFCGEGSLASIEGEAFDGNMVVDEDGNKFATIEAAIAALKAGTATASLRLLHEGTAPQGWTIDEDGVLVEASVVVETTDAVTLVAVPVECKADELINLSNRSEGDMLQVNNANGTYWSWELDTGDTGLYWKKVARVGAGTDDTPEASACTLKAGAAVWVTRKDATKPIVLNATYAAAEAKVEVAVTTGWTLVAPLPKTEAFDLKDLSVKDGSFSDGDMIVIPGAAAPINCVRKDGEWKVYTITVKEDSNAPAGWGPIATEASWDVAPKVPAGKGFFFVSEGQKTLEL